MPDLTIRSSVVDHMVIPAGGKGPGMLQPALSALGEMAERLLAVLHFASVLDTLEWGSVEKLTERGLHALGPGDLPLFAPEQYASGRLGFVPFDEKVRLRWIAGEDLLNGETVWLPAQLVLLYYRRAAAEAAIAYPTSGGLGFHTDRQRAILHGLHEVIERDAINVRWMSRLPPARVEADLARLLAQQGICVTPRLSTPSIDGIHVFVNTLDVPIPVFSAVARDRCRPERAFLGAAGAGCSRERALQQALFELGQTRTVLNSYRSRGIKRIGSESEAAEMTDFLDAALYYGYATNATRLAWYTDSPEVISWADVPTLSCNTEADQYGATMTLLQRAGMHPIAIDLNGACWPGVSVVRVIVPQLTLAGVPARPYLGHRRYNELPLQLGFAEKPLSFDGLNRDPIPFP